MANNKKNGGSKKKKNINRKNNSSNVKKTNKENVKVNKSEANVINKKNDNVVSKKADSVVNKIPDSLVNKKNDEKKASLNKAKRELVYADSGSNEITKLVKIVLIVTAIIVIFYFVTSFVTKKAGEVKKSESNEKATIQYKNLIIGSMLNKDGEYYVLIQKDKDERLSEYSTIIQMIGVNDEAPKVYTANLTDSFNKIYLADEANYDSDLSKFKVKDTTLVKVANHGITETFDNYDDIKSQLESLQ